MTSTEKMLRRGSLPGFDSQCQFENRGRRYSLHSEKSSEYLKNIKTLESISRKVSKAEKLVFDEKLPIFYHTTYPKGSIDLSLNWNFDLFMSKVSLVEGTLKIINHHQKSIPKTDLAHLTHEDKVTLFAYLSKIENSYQTNHYHNSKHALDVVCSTEVLLNVIETANNIKFSHLQRLSIILAAAAHDVAHPSVNSPHLDNFQDTNITQLFETRNGGILEQMHAKIGLDCMRKYGFRLAFNEEFAMIFVRSIMATDMSKHSDCQKFVESFDTETQDFTQLLPAILHTADISNPTKTFKEAAKWGARIYKEVDDQLRAESFIEKTNKVQLDSIKFQLGFIENLALPYFKAFSKLTKSDQLVQNINKNILTFKRLKPF